MLCKIQHVALRGWRSRFNIATKDDKKPEELNYFFASVFNSQTGYSQGAQPPVLEDRDGEQNKPPVIINISSHNN